MGQKMPSALYAPGHHAMDRGAFWRAFVLACRPFAAQAVRGSIHNLARLSFLRHS